MSHHSFEPGKAAVRLAAYVVSLAGVALAADLFVVRPGTLFHVGHVGEGLALAGFLAVWLFICFATARFVRRLGTEKAQRLDAERAAAQAKRFAQLTAALAQARTPRLVIEAALQEPLHALKADRGHLLLLSRDGASIEVARAVGYGDRPPSAPVLWDKGPVSDAIGRGALVVLESDDAWRTEYASPSGGAGTGGYPALVVVPLLIGSRVVAIVQLEFENARTLTTQEREYLGALGSYAAQALDRTWQLEFAQQARSEAETLRMQADEELVERRSVEQALRASETRYRALATRTSRLHALSAALSEAVTPEAVARAVIQHGRNVVGAIAGEVMLLADNRTAFVSLYAEPNEAQASGEPERQEVVDGLVATTVVRNGQPVYVRSLAEWQERYWRSATAAADAGYDSSATIPLLVEGAPIGVLAFYFAVPVNFDEEYQALLISVAQYCTQAIDRARLYESTQRARAEAERANREKDEFVSIVSHELRTPLNAIIGWATMLQRGSLTAEKSARALQSVCDNATRQAKLIDELLDFSRVSAGRTTYEMQNVDVRELIRGVVESMSPTAASRGVDLHAAPAPSAVVVGDVRRLEQVFFNLIENALKFTPEGGRVDVEARAENGCVEIEVRDNGAGIDHDFLPVVFDRFRQGNDPATRTYGGLGLGLSIARQLIEAHQGNISVRSGGKGCGSTFTVSIPLPAPLDSPRSGSPVVH
jgi:signal transduction histidine kinase